MGERPGQAEERLGQGADGRAPVQHVSLKPSAKGPPKLALVYCAEFFLRSSPQGTRVTVFKCAAQQHLVLSRRCATATHVTPGRQATPQKRSLCLHWRCQLPPGGSLPAGHGPVALLGTHNAIPPRVTGSSRVETTLGLHLSAKLLDCLPRPRARHGGVLSLSAWKGSRLHTARYSALFLPLSRVCMPIRPFHPYYLMT